MKKNFTTIFILALLASTVARAQHGFGTSTPDVSSVVDMVSSDKGALLPRVALTSTTVAAPTTSPANSLTVFNTANAGTAPDDVTPGYYYWSSINSKWIRLLDNQASDWHVTGNASTTAGTNFVGTTDDKALVLKVNGLQSGFIQTNTPAAGGTGLTTFGYKTGGSNTGAGNTLIGFKVGELSTSGVANTAVGYLSLNANTTANSNSAFGTNTLKVSTGASNNAFGSGALIANTTGSSNSGFGVNALNTNTSGQNNVAIGQAALKDNTTGNNNTAIGGDAGNLTNYAGKGNITGTFNNFIGSNANASADGLTYATAIGCSTSISASYTIVLGPDSVASTETNAQKVGVGIATPTSMLSTQGSTATSIAKKTNNYDMTTVANNHGLFDSTLIFAASNVTMTLPDPTTCKGRIYNFVKSSSAFTTDTIKTNTNTIIKGGTSSATFTLNNSATIQSDGTDWYVIAFN